VGTDSVVREGAEARVQRLQQVGLRAAGSLFEDLPEKRVVVMPAAVIADVHRGILRRGVEILDDHALDLTARLGATLHGSEYRELAELARFPEHLRRHRDDGRVLGTACCPGLGLSFWQETARTETEHDQQGQPGANLL